MSFGLTNPAAINPMVGAEVEFKANELGYEGAWFEGTMAEVFNPTKMKLQVTHSRFTLEDDTPHTEEFEPEFFRPRPERIVVDFEPRTCVNAFQNDCWWNGVVVKKLPVDRFLVYFPKPAPDLFIFSKDLLRLGLSWKNNIWTVKPKKDFESWVGVDIEAKINGVWKRAVIIGEENTGYSRVKLYQNLTRLDKSGKWLVVNSTSTRPYYEKNDPQEVTDDPSAVDSEEDPDEEEDSLTRETRDEEHNPHRVNPVQRPSDVDSEEDRKTRDEEHNSHRVNPVQRLSDVDSEEDPEEYSEEDPEEVELAEEERKTRDEEHNSHRLNPVQRSSDVDSDKENDDHAENLKSLTDDDDTLERNLQRRKNILKSCGDTLPDKGEKVCLDIARRGAEMQRRGLRRTKEEDPKEGEPADGDHNKEDTLNLKRNSDLLMSCGNSLPDKGKETVVYVEEEPFSSTVVEETEGLQISYPSMDDPDSVLVLYKDIISLEPEQHLTSPIINFYIRYLKLVDSFSSNQEKSASHLFFNTYFYTKLTKQYEGRLMNATHFDQLSQWWKNIDLLRMAYVFIPIHKDSHWSLVIVCFPRKESELRVTILHLDSLGYHDSRPVVEMIKIFLQDVLKYRNSADCSSDLPIHPKVLENLSCMINFREVEVPQQENDSDCGIFVLLFMKRFLEQAPQRMESEDDFLMFGRQWFRTTEAASLRLEMKDMLTDMYLEQTDEETSSGSSGERESEEQDLDSEEQDLDDTAEEIVLPKSSFIWKEINSLEAFRGKRVPHFKTLLKELEPVREPGAKVLVDSFIKTLEVVQSLEDDVRREKLSQCKETLVKLLLNGFEVEHQLSYVQKLIKIKDMIVDSSVNQKKIDKELKEEKVQMRVAKKKYRKLKRKKEVLELQVHGLQTEMTQVQDKVVAWGEKIDGLLPEKKKLEEGKKFLDLDFQKSLNALKGLE